MRISKNMLLRAIVLTLVVIIIVTHPGAINFFDYDQAWIYMMGISWLVGMVIMTWQVLLGVRSVVSVFTPDLLGINSIHRWLWVGTLSAILIHPIAVLVAYGASWMYLFTLDRSWFEWRVSLGRISRIMIIAILITSIISKKILRYRYWHRVHLLSYPAIVASWFHWFGSWSLMQLPWVRLSWMVIWVILALAIILRIKQIFAKKYQIISNKPLSDTVHELVFDPPIDSKSGQFVYVTIDWQAHPFSLVRPNTIAYKVVWDFTRNLVNIQDTIRIDWPYWVFWDHRQSGQVCIAAGIGITPFLWLLDDQTQLIYVNSYYDDIVYKHEVEKLCKCTHIVTRETYPNNQSDIVWKRFDIDSLSFILGADSIHRMFYVCWWPAFVQRTIDMLIHMWVHRQRIIYESYSL